MFRHMLLLVLVCCTAVLSAQQMRYFQFTVACGHGNWQDTSFIAATNDAAIIDSVLAELAKPLEERKFINGPIAGGSGGHNHNAHHWFKWHFVPSGWALADFAIEVCDGCPYSDVDADTAYWLGTVQQFCPWSGQPLKEISEPTAIHEVGGLQIHIYPNPATFALFIEHTYKGKMAVTLHDVNGRLVYEEPDFVGKMVNVRPYPEGVYFLTVAVNGQYFTEKVLVKK